MLTLSNRSNDSAKNFGQNILICGCNQCSTWAFRDDQTQMEGATMAEKGAQEEATFGVPRFNGPVPTPELAVKRVGVLRKTQDELIDHVREFADRWCERRHKTVKAVFEFSRASLQNASPLAAAEAWVRWYQGALHRLSDDVTDQMHLGLTLMKCGSNGGLFGVGMVTCETRQPNSKTLQPQKAHATEH